MAKDGTQRGGARPGAGRKPKALRNHEINGDSEEQERKMDEYFLSLLMERGET